MSIVPNKEVFLEMELQYKTNELNKVVNKFMKHCHCEFNSDKCPVFSDCTTDIKLNSLECFIRRKEWLFW
jgi:hypothetical protein